MKRLVTVLTVAFVISAAASAFAQAPAAPGPRHPQEGAATPAPPGPQHGGMMPMEMCRQMMGGQMMGGQMMGGGPMAGMHDMHATDPKMMSEMMELRGEMMKAMGDVMIKHARRMGAAPRP